MMNEGKVKGWKKDSITKEGKEKEIEAINNIHRKKKKKSEIKRRKMAW